MKKTQLLGHFSVRLCGKIENSPFKVLFDQMFYRKIGSRVTIGSNIWVKKFFSENIGKNIIEI